MNQVPEIRADHCIPLSFPVVFLLRDMNHAILSVMKKRWNIDWKQEAVTLLIIVVMITLQSIVVNGLYKPNGLVSGGFTGVGMLLEYGLSIPTWVSLIVLNIPVLILAFRKLHLRFTLYTLFASVVFIIAVALTENIRIPFDFSDPVSRITSALLGGVICGAASAPIIRRGASGGGFEIVSILLSKRYSFPIGTISLAFNLLVITCLAFIRGLDAAAMSAIILFVSSVAMNAAIQGLNRTKTLFVISEHWQEIAPHILTEVHRGVTLIPAKGAYTGNDKTVVYIIARTTELAVIRRIVKEADPDAMLSVIDTREVVGRGFGSIN